MQKDESASKPLNSNLPRLETIAKVVSSSIETSKLAKLNPYTKTTVIDPIMKEGLGTTHLISPIHLMEAKE